MSAPAMIAPCEVVVFVSAGQQFGLRCADVREVQRAVALAVAPGQFAAVAGTFNLRGQVVPVIDPRVLIGRPGSPIRSGDQLIVAAAGDEPVALLAERTIGIVALTDSTDDVEPAAVALCHDRATALGRWVASAEGLVLLVDPLRVLAALAPAPTAPARSGLRDILPPSLRSARGP